MVSVVFLGWVEQECHQVPCEGVVHEGCIVIWCLGFSAGYSGYSGYFTSKVF